MSKACLSGHADIFIDICIHVHFVLVTYILQFCDAQNGRSLFVVVQKRASWIYTHHQLAIKHEQFPWSVYNLLGYIVNMTVSKWISVSLDITIYFAGQQMNRHRYYSLNPAHKYSCRPSGSYPISLLPFKIALPWLPARKARRASW